MHALMCWPCTVTYRLKHGKMPSIGYMLRTDGTETAVTMWDGTLYCRTHAEEQMREMGLIDMEED